MKQTTVLALIPARGGSKGVPRKNIKTIAGKPLIAWTIESAKKAKGITDVVVSTDDEEIAAVATQYGAQVPFLRPAELSNDQSSAVDVAIHALEQLQHFDAIALLQPTSPLRNSSDLENCLNEFFRDQTAIISITAASKNPMWAFERDAASSKIKLAFADLNEKKQRQELPQFFFANGAIYISSRQQLFKNKSFLSPETRGFLMPFERSIDIDTPSDFEIAEYFLNKLKTDRIE